LPHCLVQLVVMPSVLDNPIQTGAPVHDLSAIFSEISLLGNDTSDSPPLPPLRSPAKPKPRHCQHKKPEVAVSRWIPPPTATPSRAKRGRTVRLAIPTPVALTRIYSVSGLAPALRGQESRMQCCTRGAVRGTRRKVALIVRLGR